MPAEHFAGLDAGSSGVRCVIVRPGAGKVASARREWQYTTPPDTPFGWSFDAGAFWSLLCEVTRAALAEAGLSGADIAAVGVTSQRLAVVIVDAQGRALYAGPNIDARAFAQGLAIDAKLAHRVYESGGKLPSLLLAPAKLQWLRSHQPDAAPAAVLTLGDWAAYKLTGELRNERSLACDAGLLDVRTRERDDALLKELDMAPELLPPLVHSDEVIGAVSAGAAGQTGLAPGTPVVIAGADTQCALLAMGVEQPGDAGIVAGWSCPVQQVTAQPSLDAARRTWTSLHVARDRWVLESSAADAGRAWRWWCETLLGEDSACLEHAAHLAAEAAPGSGDVLAFLGTRAMNAGNMSPRLGGMLMVTPVGPAGRPQLLRAGLENLAFALRANLEQAQEVSGLAAGNVTVGGGFTRIAMFPQLLADVLARAIEVAQDEEVSARGAALLAARAVGASDGMLTIETRPAEPDAGAVKTYERSYARWRRAGEALDSLMQELP